MCSTVFNEPKLHIADKDIVCYKYVNMNVIKSYLFGIIKKCEIVSKYNHFKYELNVIYKTELEPFRKDITELYKSGKGFYSYKDKRYSIGKLVKCIIPKGAKYYLTEDNETDISLFPPRYVYISDQIKIVEIL